MSRPIPALFLAIVLITTGVSALAAKEDPSAGSWLDGLALVELETDDVGSLHRAMGVIQSYGGRIGVVSPPSLLLGWIPYDVREELIGQAGIRDIYVSEVLPGDVAAQDRQTHHMVEFFNSVSRGEYQEKLRLRMAAAPGQWPDTRRPDGILAEEPFDKDAYLQNLIDNGFDIQQLDDRGILLYGSNSLKMTSTSTVTLIFVESDGSGADPNSYTWTDAHVQDYIDGVNAGLLWWSDQTNNFAGCWAAFFIRYFPPTDSRCQQWREMVLHPSSEVSNMAGEIMGNFGYTSGGALARTDAFNTAQKATYGTDWAYTAYIAYNPPPAPEQLTNGTSAFAYLNGPYTFLLYRSYSWPVEQVYAHETGHIYGACDEYLDSGCSCASICNQGVLNGNCAACGGTSCMMKANTFSVCTYTDDHLGWRTVPCAPAPLTPPTASTVFPTSGIQGTEVELAISGSDFLYGAFASLGPGVTITSSTLVGSDSLYVTIQIDNAADVGARNVTVSNRDLQSSTLAGAFTVLQTTRHYMSPSGGNVFPYLNAADAATSLAAAISAAGDGDSVLVETTTITPTSLTVLEDVTLVGAWNSSFTARDLVSGKTTIQPVANVSFLNTTGGGLDGFIIEGGTGVGDNFPTPGNYGGAVRCNNATVTLRNCELRSCDAEGYGGGISMVNGVLTVEDCSIHDNLAVRGGGIYLYGSAATLTNVTIVDNDIAQFGGGFEGGGILAENCSAVVMNGVVVEGNLGAANGGGLYLKNSTGVSISGGSVSGHTVTGGAAAIHAVKSQLSADGVAFDHNAGLGGGAVALADTSDATFTNCKFSWNTGVIGGGIFAATGTLALSHNLFVGNVGNGGGGGVYATSLASGVIMGNTMDRNASASGGGMLLVNSASLDTVFNNIVTNTTGTGIQCSGTAPTLIYNDVWNSSGADYAGCSAGTGSIAADPAFADTSQCDYRLGAHSPAIDTGRPGASWDDPDGSPGDMGRYGSHAFTMEQPVYPKSLAAALESGDVVLTWSANPEADVAQYAVYCDSAGGFAPGAGNFVTFVAAPDTAVNLGAPADTAYYRVAAIDTSGYASGYSNETSIGPATAIDDAVVYENRLFQNVPNPFNPTTTIRFELAAPASVSLVVYDVSGRVVKRLLGGATAPGVHRVVWDGRNDAGARVSSGVYFYRLATERFTRTRKMVMLK